MRPALLQDGGMARGFRRGDAPRFDTASVPNPTQRTERFQAPESGQPPWPRGREQPPTGGPPPSGPPPPIGAWPDPAAPEAGQRRPRRGGRPKVTVTRVAVARTREITGRTARRINAASRADGAGDTGLSGLVWTSAVNTAGDALIAVSLAGTLFFAAAVDAQRGNVALYLLITVAPFAVVAPLIGPMFDRLQRGRRWALAGTLIGRAVLAWIMAANYDNFALYPAALGALILSKAFGVLKASVVPRVLPDQLTLVAANARMSIFGLAAAGVLGGIGAGVASVFGFSWELALTATVFLIGAVLAVRLPAHVETSDGELQAQVMTSGEDTSGRLKQRALGSHVVTALRATGALRGLAGFLTIFMAFLLQATIGKGTEGTIALGAVAAGAGVGSFVGTAIGSRVKGSDKPDILVLISTGIAAAVAVVTALTYSLVTAVLMALVAGTTNSLGKTALDAIIQREVPEALRASAFGRSETLLQLSWVFGGTVGILLPTVGWIGFTVAAVLLVVAFGLTLYGRNRPRRVKVTTPDRQADLADRNATMPGHSGSGPPVHPRTDPAGTWPTEEPPTDPLAPATGRPPGHPG